MKTTKPQFNAQHFDIIKELFYTKSSTSAILSNRFGKSIPMINKALSELTIGGLIEEQGLAPSSGGRRPVQFSLTKNKMFVMVIAMDQLSTRIGLVDVFNSYKHPVKNYEIDLTHNENALQDLHQNIENYISESKIERSKIIGIGIGMPGFVDVKKGINFTYLTPPQKTLAAHLHHETGIPTFIDNDSSLVALAEYKFGNISSNKEVMVINLGWGIGLGMIVNGTLFRGHSGFAGELSHIPITEEEILCSCGKQGCLEAVASLFALTEKASRDIKNGKVTSLKFVKNRESKVEMGNAIISEANKGDQYAIELISESAYNIGRALSILIHIMNPQTIILSGRTVRAGRIMLAPIHQALNKYCIPRLFSNTEIKISELGFDAELIGASILVIDNLEKLL
jgi:glucokinase-like ROK family protein